MLSARDERGFTLVELLVVAALMVVVVGAAMGLLLSAGNSEAGTARRSDASMRTQVAMERLTREMHQAASFNFFTSQIVDVNTWVRSGTGSAQIKRLYYDCSQGHECRRYELAVGAPDPSPTSTAYTVFAQGLRNVDVFTPQPAFLNPTAVEIRMELDQGAGAPPLELSDGTDLANVN